MMIRAIQMMAVGCVMASVCVAEVASVTAPDGQRSWYGVIKDKADELKPFTVTIYTENDGSFHKKNNKQDRHYTNGLAISVAYQPEWAEKFAHFVPLGEKYHEADTAAGFIAGHMMFTPELLSASRVVRTDRPYAGYLFAGVYVQRSNGGTFDHAQLDIGVTGPASQADHLQNDIHKWIDTDEAQGWKNQLHDEVTAQLTLRRKWRVDLWETGQLSDWGLEQQLIPQVEVAAGSVYRHVGAGATWRIGHNLPDDFGPGRLGDVASATGKPSEGHGGYGFVRVSGKVVEHDLFLDGNNYKSSHGVDAETLAGEIQAGIEVFCHVDGWKLGVGYSQTFLSKQFQGQDGTDAYGGLTGSISRGF